MQQVATEQVVRDLEKLTGVQSRALRTAQDRAADLHAAREELKVYAARLDVAVSSAMAEGVSGRILSTALGVSETTIREMRDRARA